MYIVLHTIGAFNVGPLPRELGGLPTKLDFNASGNLLTGSSAIQYPTPDFCIPCDSASMFIYVSLLMYNRNCGRPNNIGRIAKKVENRRWLMSLMSMIRLDMLMPVDGPHQYSIVDWV